MMTWEVSKLRPAHQEIPNQLNIYGLLVVFLLGVVQRFKVQCHEYCSLRFAISMYFQGSLRVIQHLVQEYFEVA